MEIELAIIMARLTGLAIFCGIVAINHKPIEPAPTTDAIEVSDKLHKCTVQCNHNLLDCFKTTEKVSICDDKWTDCDTACRKE